MTGAASTRGELLVRPSASTTSVLGASVILYGFLVFRCVPGVESRVSAAESSRQSLLALSLQKSQYGNLDLAATRVDRLLPKQLVTTVLNRPTIGALLGPSQV
jgi:hypothetical protein